jgi:hypothetical protein
LWFAKKIEVCGRSEITADLFFSPTFQAMTSIFSIKAKLFERQFKNQTSGPLRDTIELSFDQLEDLRLFCQAVLESLAVH